MTLTSRLGVARTLFREIQIQFRGVDYTIRRPALWFAQGRALTDAGEYAEFVKLALGADGLAKFYAAERGGPLYGPTAMLAATIVQAVNAATPDPRGTS